MAENNNFNDFENIFLHTTYTSIMDYYYKQGKDISTNKHFDIGYLMGKNNDNSCEIYCSIADDAHFELCYDCFDESITNEVTRVFKDKGFIEKEDDPILIDAIDGLNGFKEKLSLLLNTIKNVLDR